MKVAIVKRETRGDAVWRVLECGHEQIETHGSRSGLVIEALCCRSHEARSPRPPIDTRNELQHLADDVEAVHVWPTRAWSRSDVALRKLVDAAKKHACSKPVEKP